MVKPNLVSPNYSKTEGTTMKKIIALLLTAVLVMSVFGIFSGCEALPEPGKVCFLNCVPEASEMWQKLAAAYTDIYGVEVTVHTVSSEDCTKAVQTALTGDHAPTVFQFHTALDWISLSQYCMDLTDTQLLGQAISEDFVLKEGNTVRAVGYSYEASGIIVNTKLLTQAGYEVENIQDFASLKAVAEDIHSRADELGFDAFASSGLDASSVWRFADDLANVTLYYEYREQEGAHSGFTGKYLEQYRQIWDLYIDHSAADKASLLGMSADMSLEEFGTGKAVFMQHSASVFDELVEGTYAMDPSQLTMIPIYCGVEGEQQAALCYDVEGYWAVNAQASEADRQATLAFLNWVAASEYGTTLLEEQFGGVPFKAAGNSGNVFYSRANALINEGKYIVTWASYHMADNEQWRASLKDALVLYSKKQNEANWEVVKAAFVEGWTTTGR